MAEITEIIEKMDLKSHPEGGYYKRIYESKNMIDTPYGQRLGF
jgi:predicted cupin superfamily sugar epimerase